MPNLSFIPRGKNLANPGDLFLSPKVNTLFTLLREEFDYVLIDTSPVFAVDDAPTLAPKVDGTLFIVRNGYSSAAAVQGALELLEQRQVKVLGVIFNRADAKERNYYYYNHAEYYRHPQTA